MTVRPSFTIAAPGRVVLRILQAMLAMAIWSVHNATAGTGEQVTAPHPKVAARHGMQLSVDTYWVEGHGYRPVRVVATATGAVDYDRSIKIEFHSSSQYWRETRPDFRVVQEFSLRAGETSAAATINVPQFQSWGAVGWTATIDGGKADELSASFLPGPSQQGDWDDTAPRALLIVATAPQRTSTTVPAPLPPRQNNRNRAMMLATAATSTVNDHGSATAVVAPQDLPERWVDYSSLDLIYISMAELQTVVSQHAESWQAIRRWTAAGGNLVIHNLGDGWEQIELLEEALGLRTQPAGPPPDRGWQSQREAERKVWPGPSGQRVAAYMEPNGPNDYVIEAAIEASDMADEIPPKPGGQIFEGKSLWQPYHLGSVVVVTRLLDAAANDRFDPREPVHLLSRERQLWPLRHGLLPDVGTMDYWNLLIPDVGLAPVTAFRVMITLFVIVIGPVNYFLLRRWGRLHLLLLTVPLSAALVTVGLLAYALLSDGLGVRTRIRSYTEIDQRRAEAVCWSRQSYYAGLAPAGGLRMPTDTVVLPVLPHSYAGRYNDALAGHELQSAWGEDQHLARGWLNSRTPTQYLAISARRTDSKLHVRSSQRGLNVRNHLGTKIHQLVVCAADGTLHWGESIERDAAAMLQATDAGGALVLLGAVFRRNHPLPPDELARGSSLFGLQSRYWNGYWDPEDDYHNVAMGNSRLEWALAVYGYNPKFFSQPRTYVAVVERSPEVNLGIEGASEVASFHVVRGHW